MIELLPLLHPLGIFSELTRVPSTNSCKGGAMNPFFIMGIILVCTSLFALFVTLLTMQGVHILHALLGVYLFCVWCMLCMQRKARSCFENRMRDEGRLFESDSFLGKNPNGFGLRSNRGSVLHDSN